MQEKYNITGILCIVLGLIQIIILSTVKSLLPKIAYMLFCSFGMSYAEEEYLININLPVILSIVIIGIGVTILVINNKKKK